MRSMNPSGRTVNGGLGTVLKLGNEPMAQSDGRAVLATMDTDDIGSYRTLLASSDDAPITPEERTQYASAK